MWATVVTFALVWAVGSFALGCLVGSMIAFGSGARPPPELRDDATDAPETTNTEA